MKKYVYRKNSQFTIDKEQLKPAARRDDICNAIYAAIYTEFSGASKNKVYSHLTPAERLDKMNEFIEQWLKQRGLE
jgi:hypothetical protein